MKEDMLELLIQVVRGLSVSLPTLLLSGSLSAVDRKQQLNAVKMSVFLLCKLTETVESDSYRETIVTAPSKVLLNVKLFIQVVLNSSPHNPPLCTFCMYLLSLQTFVLFDCKCPAKWTSQDNRP